MEDGLLLLAAIRLGMWMEEGDSILARLVVRPHSGHSEGLTRRAGDVVEPCNVWVEE